jgi:hypothetical protein
MGNIATTRSMKSVGIAKQFRARWGVKESR